MQTAIEFTPEELAEIKDLMPMLNPWRPHPENRPQSLAYNSEATEILYGGSAGGGKGIHVLEVLPTPSGFIEMGDVAVGTELFDENGSVCNTTWVSPIHNRRVFRITFDDGTTILADDEHRWLTYDAKELTALTKRTDEYRTRRRARRPSRVGGNKSVLFTNTIIKRNSENPPTTLDAPTGTIRNTEEISKTFRLSSGRTNYAIKVANFLNLPETKLPIDPYTLGVWLGDGSKSSNQIGMMYSDIVEIEKYFPYETTKNIDTSRKYKQPFCIIRLHGDFWENIKRSGLYKNKHVPAEYLRGSRQQRISLLQGLMDADGTVADSGSVEFDNTNPLLANAVLELVISLGWKARIREGRAKLYEKDCGKKYSIKWTPDDYVFRLDRKRNKQKFSTRRVTRFRYIVNCEEIESVPTKCIAVDSPSHLYLAGRSMIPTHNTQVILGLARMKHTRSLIVRRNFPELERSVISAALEFMGGKYNQAKHVILVGDKRIEFGHIERPGSPQVQGDEHHYSSAPYDLIAFDQLEEFPEYPYMFMFSRLRSGKLGQKTQMISTANWVGENLDWIIRRWGAWLGEHPVAKSGEVLWFYRFRGDEVERVAPNGDKIYDEGAKDWVFPTSRTFIQAGLSDNPYLGDEYKAKLQQLPEPMRSALLYGDLNATRQDGVYQLIPRAWVRESMKKWTSDGRPRNLTPVIGVDVARGGEDKTVFAPRYGNWYDKFLVYPGADTPDGQSVAALAMNLGNGVFNVDVIGVGASAYDILKETRNANPINFGAGSELTDKSGLFRFLNERAAQYWSLKDALDPSNPDAIILPPDEELEAELCAMIWVPEGKTIRVKSKEEIRTVLGRSPDKADAVVLANANRLLDWTGMGRGRIHGYESKWR